MTGQCERIVVSASIRIDLPKLDRLIAAAQKRRLPDPFEILRLKKLKLAVKDRIAHALRRRSPAH